METWEDKTCDDSEMLLDLTVPRQELDIEGQQGAEVGLENCLLTWARFHCPNMKGRAPMLAGGTMDGSGTGRGPPTMSSMGTPLEPQRAAHLPQLLSGWVSMVEWALSMDIVRLASAKGQMIEKQK